MGITADKVVSLHGMKARWAFSEIRSPRFALTYQQDPKVPLLYARICSVTFECLSPSEVDTLAQLYESIRGCCLNHYIAEVREFVIEQWSAEQLGQVYAMSELDASGEGRYQPFATYAASPCTTPTAWLDPRLAAEKLSWTTTFRQHDPLIVGLYRGLQVLIDGYVRGLVFTRTASPGERVAVLAPVPLVPVPHPS